jgi:topoisomerase-4 subunit B
MHPEEKAPVIELVFTRLHAGGKFDKGKGGAYSFSGGLHGVGVSVTNALAKRMEVTSYREGQVAASGLLRRRCRRSTASCARLARATASQGTAVRVWPDAKYFESAAPADGRADASAAQQGGADARRQRHAGARKSQRQPNLALQRRPARLLDANPQPATRSFPCSKARALPMAATTALPKARAPAGAVAFTEDGQPGA